MFEKMKKQRFRIFLEIFLTAFILCILPQHRAAAAVGIQQISLGVSHSAALKQDGSLWLWGSNNHGQLGNGNTKSSNTPVRVMTGVRQVSLGDNHSAAVKQDGSLWMWGSNHNGELGNGSTQDSSIPVKVMTGVQAVNLGHSNSAALKTDGSLWMWGRNWGGELGNGRVGGFSSTPVKVLTQVREVSLENDYSAAVKQDGSLWAWGNRRTGGRFEEYTGSVSDERTGSNIPVKVLTGVRSVSLGTNHSAVLKTDGSLQLSGSNGHGELGEGSIDGYGDTPVVMTEVKEVSLGYDRSAALKTDGSLWMWGYNSSGQLGNGSTEDSGVPVKVLTGVQSVSLRTDRSAAVKTDGSLWMWGNNGGMYGDGSTASSNVPVKIILSEGGTEKVSIAKCKITLSKKKYTYTGKPIKPLPTVKYNGKTLKNRTDYTLIYKDNKKRGTATIIIKGKGSYTGQSQIKFTIKK